MQHHVRMGRMARIRYRGGAEGVDMIDDRSEGEPLVIMLGERRVPKGIEMALFEMDVGERRHLRIPREQGYGYYDPREVQWYPRSILDHGYDLEKGSILVWTNPEDHTQRPARVIDVTEDGVLIDLNHPFAGKDLEYWVELVELM